MVASLHAGTTAPCAFVGATLDNMSILCIEGVTVGAVGFGGMLGTDADAPKRVLPMRDRLDVVRVDTGAVAAEMIQFQTFRDRTGQEFVSEAVCLTSPRRSGRDAEPAIAVRVWTRPYPTGTEFGTAGRNRPVLVDEPPEADLGRGCRRCRRVWRRGDVVRVAMLRPPPVMNAAVTLAVVRDAATGDGTEAGDRIGLSHDRPFLGRVVVVRAEVMSQASPRLALL